MSIKSILAEIAAALEGFAASFLHALGKQIAAAGPQVIQIVKDGVAAAQAQGGSGSDKWVAARNKIEAELTSQGLSIATHIINGMIEAEVANLTSGAHAS